MQPRPRVAAAFAGVGVLLALGAEALASASDDSLRSFALRALGLELLIGFAACGGAALTHAPLRDRLGLAPGRLGNGAIALLALGTLALSHALDAALELLDPAARPGYDAVLVRLAGARGLGLTAALLGLAIAPGIAEELLCRGLIQRTLTRRLDAPRAILLAALVFGVLHLEPSYVLQATILGLYLGIVAHLHGGIRASIFCHATNNLAVVTLAALDPGGFPAGLASLWGGLAVALTCLWLAGRGLRGWLQTERGSDDA